MEDFLRASSFAQRFNLTKPIALAPMALASGGRLASACAMNGALGLVGGGYGDLEWTSREYSLAVQLVEDDKTALARMGCGFITWKLEQDRSALDWVLDQQNLPAAVMLSFGDPRTIGREIVARGIPLVCQIQTIAQLPEAVEAGACVIVAQGGEAGGHGMNALEGRSTFTFVPECADWLAKNVDDVDLLAAGGIADGRGLTAAMMLGASGALVGSRLWASEESLAETLAIEEAVKSDGDGTARSAIFDILRRKHWPKEYDFRALRNEIHRRWEFRMDELREAPDGAIEEYDAGVRSHDYLRAHVTVGEGTGLIKTCQRAEQILSDMVSQAEACLAGGK